MAERPELAFMSLLVPILLLFAASPTQAQTFNTPYLNTPIGMIKGSTYTITCNCISVGTAVTIAFKRSDQISSFSGNPACNIISNTQDTWFCVGEYRFTARAEDIGVTVTCSATQQGDPTPKTDSAILRVEVPPPSQYPEITGPDTVTANENNTWTCVVDGALPAATIRWRIGATNVYTNGVTHPTTENSEGLFRSSSSLSNVFLSSGGIAQIHCDMEHDTGARKTATKNVQVQYKPIITSTPTSYTATEGVTQRLECSINAVPTATVVGWLKDNTAVDRSSGKYSGGNSFSNPDLDIVNPQKEDSGVYVCTATNILGSTYGPDVTVTVRYKPKVSIPNDNYDGNIRGSLTIPCNIDANPGVNTISWRRISTSNLITTLSIPSSGGKYSGGTQSTPALTINNLDNLDALRYQCVATNMVGNGESNIVNVIISYAPTNIQVSPQSVRVDVGQAVTASCFADGVPTPTYAWYFESNTQTVSTGQTLSIPSAQPADNGQYTCLATNTKGNASIVIAVSVWYAPILTTNTSPQAVDEGSTLTLKCTIDANPSTYSVSWLKDGALVDRTNTRLSGGNDSITPDLTITNIQSVDAGSYRCRVTHFVATSRSDIVDVQIAFPPRNIVLNPADPVINLNEGDALNLTCSVDAVPTPTITWKAGSTVIGSGSSLVIASARPLDNREVTCEVSNSKGQTTKTTRINVSYTPRVTIPGGAAFGVDEGNSLTIPCIVDANPADDTFDWLRDSNILNLTDNAKYGGGTRTSRNLTIYSLASSDAGNYSCRSVNSVGTDTSREVIVTISYKPENVRVNPTTVTITEGSPISVTCSADGVPSPTFTWLKGEVTIDGPLLNVTSAEPEDAGIYTCQATNDKGTASVSVVVQVQYMPRVTSPGDITSAVGDDITIQCSILSIPNVTSVTWQMMKESVVKTLNISNSNNKYGGGTVSNPSLTINDLDIDDVGQYQCKGTNVIGTGSGSYVTVVLSSAPAAIAFSPSAVSVNEGETIKVTCSSDGTPTPTYEWFRNGVKISIDAELQINSATPEDNANFSCRATNNKGSKESVLAINVSYKPRGSGTNPVFRTTVGTAVTLTCQVKANPPATGYSWSFGGVDLNHTRPSLVVTPVDDSDFGQYTCSATNTVGTSDPIIITLAEGTTNTGTTNTPGTGESTAAAGLPTSILILIIILILLLILIIIIILVICYKKGKLCKKKDPKGRVGPVTAAAATVEVAPRPTEKPITEANSGLRSPQWSAVSRQHVTLDVNGQHNKEPDKLSIEDETPVNGTIANGAIAGGTIISLPDGNTPRPHHLPPVDTPTEKKKKRRRKKKKKDKTDSPAENPISEEEEEEE